MDKLGNLQDAVRSAAGKADLKEYEGTYVEQPLTAKEKLIKRLNQFLFSYLKDGFLGDLYPSVRSLNAISNELKQLMQFNDPNGLYAYCLTCDVQ